MHDLLTICDTNQTNNALISYITMLGLRPSSEIGLSLLASPGGPHGKGAVLIFSGSEGEKAFLVHDELKKTVTDSSSEKGGGLSGGGSWARHAAVGRFLVVDCELIAGGSKDGREKLARMSASECISLQVLPWSRRHWPSTCRAKMKPGVRTDVLCR